MKLQNLSLLFVIIVLPLLLMVSYYISLQIDTINMQTSYNTKLLDSTKEAIDAFEINTVEWNANYAETADSKRRDVMASINTFTTSLANNLGVAGTSKEYMIARIPAIAYTLYDGYYIYSPAETKKVIKDDNGVAQYMSEKLCNTTYKNNQGNVTGTAIETGYTYKDADEGKILYEPKDGVRPQGTYVTKSGERKSFTLNQEDAAPEKTHILKPFTSYSEQLTDQIVINYTLDNYITLYGNMPDTNGTTAYISKSGYLTDTSKIAITFDKVTSISETGGIKGIQFEGNYIKPEKLQEKISYKKDNEDKYEVKTFYYVYESEGNTKVYYDEAKEEFFQLDSESKRIFMSDLPTELYKKCTVPITRRDSGEQTYEKYYQSLEKKNGSFDLNWYKKGEDGSLIETTITDITKLGLTDDILDDYSAVNYYVESYVFTKWVTDKLVPYVEPNIKRTEQLQDLKFLKISEENDPDPATSEDSAFEDHKRKVIKKVVKSNLNQAITSYSGTGAGEFYLPELSETDWDQILKNTSMIAFLQNIPIGMKYYNNYAIATSTVNKEYVDPNEIYLNASNNDSKYYHMPYCSSLGDNNLIGFRSIDYIQKTYQENPEDLTSTKRYYKHNDNTGINIDVEEACYSCLVQKALYDESGITEQKQKAYFTALARERYIARIARLPAKVESEAHIYVETYDITEGKPVTNAKFEIGIDPNYTNEIDTKIPKSNSNGKVYTVKALIDGEMIGGNTVTTEFGSLENSRETTLAEPSKYSIYESDSKAYITIISYENNSIKYNVDTEGNTLWGGAYAPGIYSTKPNELFLESDAYINIRLNYKRNYTSNAGEIKSVWANIDEYNKLTIATTIKGITGKIRLKFTNSGEKVFYSEDVFDIQNEGEHIIYCNIPDDINWYKDEWEVSAISVENKSITPSKAIQYYTIRNAKGLTEFAHAVNGTKPSGNSIAARTSGRTFKLIADIKDVGTMDPIAGIVKDEDKNGINDIWFDGNFEGQNHTISGMQINKENDNYNALGLFGWVGQAGKIKGITISNVNVSYKGSKNDIKIGALAGYCDKGTTINGINVSGGTIEGKSARYVGGLIGSTDRAIENCNVTGLNSITGKEYVGGIAGYATASISGSNSFSKVSNVKAITGGNARRNCRIHNSYSF